MFGSTSPVYMATRITVVLLLSWLSETASGGCTRYGHACWGGHGKRSGGMTVRDVGPSPGNVDGPAVWAPSDYVLARMASGGPLAAFLDVSAAETAAASRTGNPVRQPWEHWGDLTPSTDLGPARTGHRMRALGAPAVDVPDMMAPSAINAAQSNGAGQEDDEASAPRDLLVMASGEPMDQEQLHLYKILNRSTRKIN